MIYLGDGVYAALKSVHSGVYWVLMLSVDNGLETTSTVYLRPEAFDRLVKFVEQETKHDRVREIPSDKDYTE